MKIGGRECGDEDMMILQLDQERWPFRWNPNKWSSFGEVYDKIKQEVDRYLNERNWRCVKSRVIQYMSGEMLADSSESSWEG